MAAQQRLKAAVIGLGRMGSTFEDETGRFGRWQGPHAHAACYRAVGQSLDADRLLWAQIDPAQEKIRVTVVLFDVGAGTETRKVGTFEGVQAARAGVSDLVAHAVGRGSPAP